MILWPSGVQDAPLSSVTAESFHQSAPKCQKAIFNVTSYSSVSSSFLASAFALESVTSSYIDQSAAYPSEPVELKYVKGIVTNDDDGCEGLEHGRFPPVPTGGHRAHFGGELPCSRTADVFRMGCLCIPYKLVDSAQFL